LLESPGRKVDNFVAAQSFWLFNEPPKEADKVTIVAIDQTSRERLGVKWPWERKLTATLIRNIAAFSPKAIGLDIIFSGTSEQAQDDALISALQAHPNTVLGYILQDTSRDHPDEPFSTTVSSMGFVDKPLEAGLIRDIALYYRDDAGNLHLPMDIQLVRAYWGLDGKDIAIDATGMSLQDKAFIPSHRGRTPLNYLVYPTHLRIIPAIDVMNNTANPSDFSDKIVLVGATDPLIHDEHPTVLGTLPGVTILANGVAMLLSQRFLHGPPAGSGFLLGLTIGCLVLIINKHLNLLRATLLSIGLLIVVYLSFILLRSVDVTLPYFLILFAGVTAFVSFNGYKYISLLYVTNRIRRQAILDPITGLYAPRYFMLQLREALKTRGVRMFGAIRMENYEQMSMGLAFDPLKALLKQVSQVLANEFGQHFARISASRIQPDTYAVQIEGGSPNKLEGFWDALGVRLASVWPRTEGENHEMRLKGGFIFKPKHRTATDSALLFQIERLLKDQRNRQYLLEELDPAASISNPRIARMDMLEFIAFDWAERNKELEDRLREVTERNIQLNRLNWGTLDALARTIDAKSPWTAGHSERVTQIALTIGRVLNLEKRNLDTLHRAALLHDIGKIAVPNSILDKPGKLTDDEYKVVCEHPATGARILEPIESYREIIPIVRQHHERFDGNGYPDCIAGDKITREARILAVADVYDALTSERPYRKGMSHHRAMEIITEGRGTQFDPMVVDIFLEIELEKMAEWGEKATCPVDQTRKALPGSSPCIARKDSPVPSPFLR
jgi:putative nucleotidyltransferase with HDIG domain